MSTTSPVSIASSSSAAAAGGSVIDVASLVSQLVTATETPQQNIIAAATAKNTTQISAVGTLKGALSTFQSALSSLDTPAAFNAETASSSDNATFQATANSSSVSGTYSVSITNLASAQQIVSGPFDGGATSTIGDGTLQLSLGGSSFNVTVDSSNDTVAGLAAAINAAPGNPGISATIITGTDGAHLVLSSTQTGAANSIGVTETDGGTALSAVTYGTNNTGNYAEKSEAKDAVFSIAGIPYTSASNTVSDALTGVSLTLLAPTTTGNDATLTVASNTTTIQSNISNFVSAYNALVGSMSSLGSYDATTSTAGPMLGDALLSGIQNGLRSTLYSVVNSGSSVYNSLASVGITTNKDGTLSLNSATLQSALASSPSAVSSLFSGTGGIATNLNSQITTDLATNGPIASRSSTLVSQSNALTQQTSTLNDQMTALTASLTQQYATLNTLLSSLQSTSAYLTQQIASLPQIQSKSNS